MQYRPDIDVLRAIAVLAVVFFHAGFHIAFGGYVGVDVFFVISGYLITKKLRSQIAQGSFSFRNFYIDRARRLFPALFVTVAVTLLTATLLMASDHLKELALSTVWTIVSVSNVFFWLGSGYWSSDNVLKPLLHTWSLSVEEQFYLVWPLGLAYLSRFPTKVAPTTLIIVGIISLIAAAMYFNVDAEAVFFLTPFRIFEFTIGALLVWLEPLPRRSIVNQTLSTIGFCFLIVAIISFRPHTPIVFLAVPCLGAALMIVGGVAPSLAPLWNNPAGVYIGRISYSIYLVHWPLIVFYQYWRYSQISHDERIGLVVASIALAIPLHHWVEQPFRYGKPAARLRFASAWGALSLVLVVVGTAAAVTIKPAIRPMSDPWVVERASRPLCEGGYGLCNDKGVALIGDSHAIHYAPAVAETLKQARLSGTLYPMVGACPFVLDISPAAFPERRDDCINLKADWLARIRRDDPRVIILAGLWEDGMGKGFGKRYASDVDPRALTLEESRQLWATKMQETIGLLLKGGRKIILLGNGPLVDTPPSVCFDRPALLSRFDCAKMNIITDPVVHAFTRATLAKIQALHPHQVLFLDVWPYLCNGDQCPLSDGGQTFYKDQHHLTAYGSLWLQRHAFAELSQFLTEGAAPTN